jgi:poly(A) polymerase
MTNDEQADLKKLYTDKLSRQTANIDNHALQIVKRLKEAKFEAYLVGGGVRDLLVNLKPKDFDIATSASPQEVKRKISNAFIIGRRFKLVHARRGDSIYEVATFRRAATSAELETTEEEDRRMVEENFFGNIEEDSFRRDFTVNSLYYDPIDNVIVDHCKGLQDIHERVLRMIGDPKDRLIEDPIRILRAIRLSQKLRFSIEPTLREQLYLLKDELKKSASPRIREEWIKFFRLKDADQALMELFDLGIFEVVMPSFQKMFLVDDQRETFLNFVRQLDYYNFNLSDTTELMSAILMSYLHATHPEGVEPFNIDKFVEDEKFVKFCRDELGVFKAEVGSFLQAMHFLRPLQNKSTYLKKGDRRQRSMVSNQAFWLSLKLGLLSQVLSISDYAFWEYEHERLLT